MGRYCTSCGSQNDDAARFCRDCGKAMSGSTPSAARSEPTSHGGTGDGMTVGYYLEGLHKYAEFEGRSSRAEFWWFTLVLYAIQFAIRLPRRQYWVHSLQALRYYLPSYSGYTAWARSSHTWQLASDGYTTRGEVVGGCWLSWYRSLVGFRY